MQVLEPAVAHTRIEPLTQIRREAGLGGPGPREVVGWRRFAGTRARGHDGTCDSGKNEGAYHVPTMGSAECFSSVIRSRPSARHEQPLSKA